MKFKDTFEKYMNGTATEAESIFIEEELEKGEILHEYFSDDGPQESIKIDSSTDEIQNINRSLKKRNRKTILISIVLCIALILLGKFALVPLAEKAYWNPEKSTYEETYATDFRLLMTAYTELFNHGEFNDGITVEHKGFSKYDLAIRSQKNGNISYHKGQLDKGTLTLDNSVIDTSCVDAFAGYTYGADAMTKAEKKITYDRLKELPEYIRVEVAVTFPEDLDMNELIEFDHSLSGTDSYVEWSGIRVCRNDDTDQCLAQYGINAFTGGPVFSEINNDYPEFNIWADHNGELTAEILETHFTSLIKYCYDSEMKHASGIEDAERLNSIINYIDANGVKSYGCYLSATPSEVLKLLDDGFVSQAYIINAEIALD